IRFNTAGVKCSSRGAEKIPTRATNLQELSGRFKFPDKIEAPIRIQQCKPMFFFQAEIAKLAIGLAHFFDGFLRRSLAEHECRLPFSDVTETTLKALHEGPIEAGRLQNEPCVGAATEITFGISSRWIQCVLISRNSFS